MKWSGDRTKPNKTTAKSLIVDLNFGRKLPVLVILSDYFSFLTNENNAEDKLIIFIVLEEFKTTVIVCLEYDKRTRESIRKILKNHGFKIFKYQISYHLLA